MKDSTPALFAAEQWAMLPESLMRLMVRWDAIGASSAPFDEPEADEADLPSVTYCYALGGDVASVSAAVWAEATSGRPDDVLSAGIKAAAEAGRTVAVVPVIGPITKRDTMFSFLFGGTSVNRLIAQVKALRADESVSAVLLNVDSPGGSSSGLTELAAEIRSLRESKRVVAIVNDMAASGGYWIASQANEIVGTPSSLTGSVGAYTLHVDYSGALAKEGIKPTFIYAGKHKVDGNPYEPLSDEAKAHAQSIVDAVYATFVNDVAAGRGVLASAVRSDYGEGRVLVAKDAKAAGMIDRIDTYTGVLSRMAQGKASGTRAEDVSRETSPDLTDPQHAQEALAGGEATVNAVREANSLPSEDESRARRARLLYG